MSVESTNFVKSGVAYSFWVNTIIPAMFHIKGKKCEECGSKKYIDIHHTRYDIQTIDTLKVLCRSCHSKWHYANGTDDELIRNFGVIHPENKYCANNTEMKK